MKKGIHAVFDHKVVLFLVFFCQVVALTPIQQVMVAAEEIISNEVTTTLTSNYDSEELDISLVPIVSEDTSLRTSNEKYYRKLDGTYEVAIYPNEVHYLDDGQWRDIDNRLDGNESELTNKNNHVKTTFPKILSDSHAIKVKLDDYAIDWKVLDIESSPADYSTNELEQQLSTELIHVNQSVTYANIQEHVDLQYVLQGSDIKETIVLNDYVEDFSLSFEYSFKNLSVIEQEDGIHLVNAAHESVFRFEDLFMIDQEQHTSLDVTYEMEALKKDTYRFTIHPSDEWLKRASYPVSIDPTLSSTYNPITIYDTYISEAAPDANFAGSTTMYLSNTISTAEYKGLIYFVMPSTILNQTITYAHLSFTPSQVTTGTQLNIYKNIRGFSSGSVTWNSWENGSEPSYEDTVVDYHVVKSGSPILFDITKPIKEWVAEGTPVIGGFTIAHDDGYGSVNSVYQKEINSTSRPLVKIGYENPSGLKNYWTYTAQELGTVGTGYISDYTGNLTFVRNEYQLQNEYLPLSLSFIYNNYSRSVDIGYGRGWRTNYSYEVKLDSSINAYYLHQPDGNQTYFLTPEVCMPTSAWTQACDSFAEDGSGMILRRNLSDDLIIDYQIITRTNISYNFNYAGRLTSVQHTKTLHTLNVSYVDSTSLKIAEITDQASNKLSFIYDNNVIKQTTLQLKQDGNPEYVSIESHSYSYDSSNRMITIHYDFNYGSGTFDTWTSNDTDSVNYSYDSASQLIEAYHSYDQFKVTYGYNTGHRVTSIITTDDALWVGNTSINYANGQTIYTDYEGDSIYYSFDHYGHTVNIRDDYGTSTSYRYSGLFTNFESVSNPLDGYDLINLTPNYMNNHHLIESSSPLKQNRNPILNHGFEENGYGWTLNKGTGNIVFSYDQAVLGEKSLKISRLTSTVEATQSIYLLAGSYKIEAWIKNSGATPGAYIDINNVQGKGTINKVYNTNEWTKYELTFYMAYPNTVTIKLINESNYADAYFDNIQINEGFVDTRYNPVANYSFEAGATSWTLSGATVGAIVETGTLHDILGDKALQIVGDGSTTKQAYQTINGLYTRGATYLVGGWAKADAVPNKGFVNVYEQSDGRFFGFVVASYCDPSQFGDPSEPYTTYQYLPFDSSLSNWQYQMSAFYVPELAVNIKIYARYKGEGTAYFDNIQLYHDDVSTHYGYDATSGRLTSVVKPDGTTTNYGYDANGNISLVSQDDKETTVTYTSTNNLVETITSPNNIHTTFVYDQTTHQLLESYVGYNLSGAQDKWFKTSTTYTANKQYVGSVTDEFGNTITSQTNTKTSMVESIIDAIGNSQHYTYDDYGHLIETSMEDSLQSVLQSGTYTYDTLGRLSTINRDEFTYTFIYDDKLNQVTSVQIADETVMSYDYWMDSTQTYHTGLLKTQTYGNSDKIGFTYTENHQLESISFNNSVRYQYAYDSSGNLSIYKDLHNHSIYFYSYDLTGRLEKITDEDGNEITYRYDSNGQLDRYDYSISGVERAVLYHYNSVNGTYDYTSYSVGSTSVTKNYNYDTDSLKRLNTIELLIGTTQLSKSFVYDDTNVDSTRGNATNRIYQVVYSKGTEDLYSHTYTYNQNHMMTQVSVMDLDNNEIIEESSYFYDGLNQLVREDVYLKNLVYETRVYAYDELNNLTSIKTYPCYVVSGTPLREKKLIYDTTWKDQLVLIEYFVNGVFSYDETLTYDFSGNVIRIDDSRDATNQQFFDWEGRQLIDYSAPCNEVSYRYNDQGLRTQKVVTTCEGSTTIDYHLDGDKVLVETHSNGITLAYTYDVDGGLLSMNYNGTEYFYVTNLQGDIIELLDSQGNTVVSYQYDAWGTILHQTGGDLAELNPYRYRGYRYDSETQWYYLQSRYYDPSIGRFISSDGLVGEVGNLVSHNKYAYAANNPVMNVQLLNFNFVETNLLSPRYTICPFQYCYSTLPIKGYLYELALNRAGNHRNPNHGVPNSVGRIVYPDGSPKQEREYGPDGRPVIDHDHHQGEDVGYDHDHDWDWNENPPRQPARTPQKIVAIIGLMGCSAAIVWLIANDVTLVGVADDGLIVATATSLALFWAILNEEENIRT